MKPDSKPNSNPNLRPNLKPNSKPDLMPDSVSDSHQAVKQNTTAIKLPYLLRILYVQCFALFFAVVLFGTLWAVMRLKLEMAYGPMLLNLAPGLLMLAGAFIRGNWLSDGVGSSPRLGLASIIGAICCMLVWDGQGELLFIASCLGGFGFAAVTKGLSSQTSSLSSTSSSLASLSSIRYAAWLRLTRLLGLLLGTGYTLLLLTAWGGGMSHSAIQGGFASMLLLLAAAFACLYSPSAKSTA